MTDFATTHVAYTENRTDGGFGWNVSYDLSLIKTTVQITLDVRLVGANPGATKTVWENGVNTIWNNRAFFSDGARLYEVKLDFSFVSSGEDQVVTVHTGTGRADMANWYLDDPWGPDKYDEVAAHEAGHMLGNYDEYAGGATHNNFVRTDTLMSDLTQAGFQDYFWTVEYYTEFYGKLTLATQLAQRGTEKADTLAGGSGLDGMYGFAGNDKISGKAGNDFIDGGSGNDSLSGGEGDDQLLGGTGNDTLDGSTGFDTLSGGSGADLADYSAFTSKLAVNMATGRVTFPDSTTAAGRFDTLIGIENFSSGGGSDTVTGSTGANNINGGGGNDKLLGGSGNDTLVGGSGADTLVGGKGSDRLTGNGGADRFDFDALSDSPGGAARDTITDFSRAQKDRIDLSTIDADTDGTSGNQKFIFIDGAAFSSVDGQLRFANGVIQGDVNGDRIVDLEIFVAGGLVLIAADFIL